MTIESVTPLVPYGTKVTPHKATNEPALFGGDGVGFDDLIDMVNPLHHLPIIGHVYRAATGDTLSAASQVVGGGLFGGAIGAAAGAVTAVAEGIAGEPLIDAALNILDDDDEQADSALQQLYAPQAATELAAHDSNSVAAFLAMQQAEATIAQNAASAEVAINVQPRNGLNLSESRDPALGLTDSQKQQQLKSSLHQTLVDL